MQINRLFEIIYLLLDKKIITAKELSEHFEVSVRTIYRDIESLSGVGIPVFMTKGKGGGISLLSDFILNKAVLTQREKNQILSSLKALNSIHPTENNTILQKLNAFLGSQNTDWIEIDFSSWGNNVKVKDTFDVIKQSILKKQLVTFSYFSSKGEYTKRLVEPLKLFFKSQSWYVYGYCRERKDFRFFKLIRIKELIVLEEFFEQVAPEQLYTSKTDSYSKELITLKLILSPQAAHRVCDEFEEIIYLKDGSFLVTIQMPNKNWIYDYILSFGEYCKVVEPVEIREDIKKKLSAMMNHYL